MDNLAFEIERLLKYGLNKGLIEKWDIVEVRNKLLDTLKVSEPYLGDVPKVNDETPVGILNAILDGAYEVGVLEENTTTYRDLLDSKIMGHLMPRSSEIISKFNDISKNESKEDATNWYYNISKASNYIRTDRIDKNLSWKTKTDYGDIDITVNLSKPEKDPKAIAAARKVKSTNYPKCLLCYENVGYQGRLNYPGRQNHRVIPLTLNEEQWYLQYSPYVYYNEHSIVFKEDHVPMKISEITFKRLLDFVDVLPHYFLGSNADLPIVGGSILSHDHFQGGKYKFPMEISKVETILSSSEFPDIDIGIVKWPMSVIRLSSENKNSLVKLANKILVNWREYCDKEADILAYSDIEGERTPHNTITPISRINSDSKYELDLVLRNNRTSEKHPDGIFHPHSELHHIKKENIGLIEVMGLAVLPGRLEYEIKLIGDILTGKKIFDEEDVKSDVDLNKHLPWIKRLIESNGTDLSYIETRKLLEDEIGKIFIKVLEHSGVFKRNELGKKHFIKFLNEIGCMERGNKYEY